MDTEELDGEAAAIYDAAECDPSYPPHIIDLARRTPGIESVEYVRTVSTGLVRLDAEGRGTIQVNARLSRAAQSFIVGHELGEFRLTQRKFPYVAADIERVCSRLSARLIAPAPAVCLAHTAHGFDLPQLAVCFDTSQTLIALRVSEVRGIALAIVGPHFVWRRETWPELPSDAALFRAVRRGEKGFRVVPLTDARCRWVVLRDKSKPFRKPSPILNRL
jgi:hypothetical protein